MWQAFFPSMPRKLALATQKEIRHLYDSNGQLNVGSFLDALLISHQFVSSNAKKVGCKFLPFELARLTFLTLLV